MPLLFDTLQYTKKLENAGIARTQAEATAEALNDFLTDMVATKRGITDPETEVKKEIDVVKWMIGLLFAQTALILTVIKFMH